MDAALEVDRAARGTPHAWMLHRFLVPASRLPSFPPASTRRWASWSTSTRCRRSAPRSTSSRPGWSGRPRWRGRGPRVPGGPPGRRRELDAVAERGPARRSAAAGRRRTCTPRRRSSRIHLRLPRPGLAFKATAGLHHPVRDGIVHGFLNLLGAAVLAHADGAEPRSLAAVLLEQDASAFGVSDEAFTVQGRAFGAEAVTAAREALFTGFGSCSFSEPVEDLRGLGCSRPPRAVRPPPARPRCRPRSPARGRAPAPPPQDRHAPRGRPAGGTARRCRARTGTPPDRRQAAARRRLGSGRRRQVPGRAPRLTCRPSAAAGWCRVRHAAIPARCRGRARAARGAAASQPLPLEAPRAGRAGPRPGSIKQQRDRQAAGIGREGLLVRAAIAAGAAGRRGARAGRRSPRGRCRAQQQAARWGPR